MGFLGIALGATATIAAVGLHFTTKHDETYAAASRQRGRTFHRRVDLVALEKDGT